MEKPEEKSPAAQLLNKLRYMVPGKGKISNNQELNNALLKDPFFIRFMNSAPSGIAIFNYESMLYEYFSPNMEVLLGYPIEKLQGVSGAEFAFNTFHPDHMNIVIKKMERVKQLYHQYSLQQRVIDTRYTFTLQLKRGNGEYMWTLMQTTVLEVAPNGFPYRSMIMLSDITGIKNNSKVDFVFAVKNKTTLAYESIEVTHHDTSKEYRLSDREVEILNCISKGMRNHEIADKLNISKHTVITHRKNIMKKTGKENIIQLLMD